MESRSIPNVPILDLFGESCNLPERDSQGDIQWENESKQVAKRTQATTYSILRDLLFNLRSPVLKQLQRPQDGKHASRLWQSVVKAESNDMVVLRKDDYDWLHDLLQRILPTTQAVVAAGIAPKTVASHLWDWHEWVVVNQLRTLEDRAVFEEVEKAESEEGTEKTSSVQTQSSRRNGGRTRIK